MPWKITPLYFLAQTSYNLDKNSPLKWIFRVLSGWVKIHQIPRVTFETTSQFFFKLGITLHCLGDKSFVLFYLKVYEIFKEKGPTAVRNFRLLTAQVKFHQICPLLGYFCWTYIMFQLKKIWRKYWYQRVVQNLKKNLFFVTKMTRIRWILIRVLKVLTNLHFDWSLLWKVYNAWSKKSREALYFVTLKSHAKFQEKMTCGLENDMRNLENFIWTLESVKIGIFMGSFYPK